MANNEALAGMLGDGTKSFLEYLRRSGRNLAEGGGAAVDWLAGGAKSGAEPTLAMMQPGAADQPFLPTADSGGRLGMLASALTGPMTPMSVPKGGMVLGAGPAVRTAEKALDMSPEARAARAAEMGYTVDAYHGTNADISAFDARRAPKNEQMGLSGVHVAERPEFANLYADGKGGNVMPVKINPGKSLDGSALVTEGSPEAQILTDLLKGTGRKPYFSSSTMDGTGPRMAPPLQGAIDMVSQAKAEKVLRAHGYDSVKYNATYGSHGVNGMNTTNKSPAYVVFDPKNIRSANAAFDPAKAGSSDLLASRAPLPAVPQTEEQKRAAIAELLRNGGT